MGTSDLSAMPGKDFDLPAGPSQTVFGTRQLPFQSMLRHESFEEATTNPKITIVDDEPVNIKVVRKHLADEGYTDFVTIADPTQAVDIIRKEQPDLVLLDIMMPQVSGLEILAEVRTDERFVDLPIIILTAASDRKTKMQALNLRATDFLTKPVDRAELVTRVRNVLMAKAHQDHLKRYAWELELEGPMRSAALVQSRLEVIHCLAQAAECRSHEAGRHVVRVGRCAAIVARQLRLDQGTVETIEHAAPLHDVGKIGIPNSVLLESAKLEAAEFEALLLKHGHAVETFEEVSDDKRRSFRSHAGIGAKILSRGSSLLLDTAARIALTHHEKWDGTGYPIGLAGEDIPVEGRITAVAHAFDVLSSPVAHRPALELGECLAVMGAGVGSHFDPAVLDAFLKRSRDIVDAWAEQADAN